MFARVMSKALVRLTPLSELAAPLDQLVERARGYAADCRASSTRRAYLSDFASFEAWCAKQGLLAIPAAPASIAVYLCALADSGRKVKTIERALSGIGHAHRQRGHEWPRSHPAIAAVMGGIRHRIGAPPAQKAPVDDRELAALLATLAGGLVGARDRALLTLGWWGALRRSALVALDVEDVARTREGLVLTLRRSKTDQEGQGALTGIAFAGRAAVCAVRAFDEWVAIAAITSGALFRRVDRNGHLLPGRLCDRTVARLVQRAAERAGLDPENFAGHSLRAGFATTAAKHGKSLDAIMRQTHHKSERVARGYIRHAEVFDDNATVGLA
jgi:integrase